MIIIHINIKTFNTIINIISFSLPLSIHHLQAISLAIIISFVIIIYVSIIPYSLAYQPHHPIHPIPISSRIHHLIHLMNSHHLIHLYITLYYS
jgi:hypothetical protein